MIFHDDWIETLNTLTPEISSRFLNYIVAYSLTGEEPELEGMEYSLWTRFADLAEKEFEKIEDKFF